MRVDTSTVPTEPDLNTRCDRCKVRTAALCAYYPGIRPRPPRWCPDWPAPRLPSSCSAARSSPSPPPSPAGTESPTGELRLAQPSGVTFLRALVDQGGVATAARLRELTGVDHLNPMTQTLNHASVIIRAGDDGTAREWDIDKVRTWAADLRAGDATNGSVVGHVRSTRRRLVRSTARNPVRPRLDACGRSRWA